ncbi:MAG: endonuclease domain-containing protein [Clostridia bacterium]|nr:endonuclease domain-containing protein [Clostridia bacterium]
MNERNNSKLTHNAQILRKSMTKEERHLWYDFLKRLPVTFNRQKVMGQYIADFYCAEKKLVIELDGSQHYMDEGQQADKERDAYFASLGMVVLRYSNREVNQQFDRVCNDILHHLATSSVTANAATPSPQGEG